MEDERQADSGERDEVAGEQPAADDRHAPTPSPEDDTPAPIAAPSYASRLDDPKIRAAILWSGILLFTFIVRLRTLQTLETSGDPFEYVLAIKEIVYRSAETWTWTHHTARFGILVPSALVFWVMGADPLAYYVVPMVVALLTSCLVFATVRRFSSTTLAVVCTAAVVLFPMNIRNHSQIAPATFLMLYQMATAYAFVRVVQTEERKQRLKWLAVMVVMTFLAYLCKVTAVFGAMGFGAALWLVTRRIWPSVVFGLGLVGLYCVEWSAYAVFTDVDGGRFGIIGRTHLTSDALKEYPSLWALAQRFHKFKGYWLYLFYTAAAAVVYFVTSKQRIRSPGAGLMLVGVTLILGTLFGLKSFDPIVPAVPLRMRYGSESAPFLMIGIAIAATGIIEARLKLVWNRRGVLLGSALSLGLALMAYPENWTNLKEHPLRVLNEYRSLAWHHAAKGTIVLGTGTHKGATKVMKGYLALLWPYHDDLDEVPDIVRYKIGRRAYYYFSKVPSEDRKARRLEQIKVEKAVRELGPFVLVKRAKEDWNFVRQKHRGYMKIEVFEHGGTGGHGDMKLPSPGARKKSKNPLETDDEDDEEDDD